MRRIIFSVLLVFAFIQAQAAERKEIHILSVNDVHAKVENFPQLAAIVDSLRAIDPQLLVMSAGDNRTGNPVNDQYEPAAYPMVALMNIIGFDCSTFGNHEFDSRQAGLAKLISLSNFPHVCANVHPDPSLGIHNVPYVIFNIDGISIGVLGVVQLGTRGLPDTHPDNVKGIRFSPVAETIKEYEWLAKKCDVNILLSHIGYEDDVKISAQFPYYDLIIGGHTHTQLKGGEMHNGVLITQNVNKLERVTLTTLIVEDGKMVGKEAKNIEVADYPKKNKVVEELVRYFSENEVFKRVIAHADNAFVNTEELGVFMCDAIRSEGDADFSVWNVGGVRLDSLEGGDMTVNTVLQLDPFGNKCVELKMTGAELHDMMLSIYKNDDKRFPYTSSNLRSTVYLDPADSSKIQRLELRDTNGKLLKKSKVYKVVANNYVTSINDAPHKDAGVDMNRLTSDMIISFLEKTKKIDYKGVTCQRIFKAQR